MTLDELTAYIEKQGFTRKAPEEKPAEPEKQPEPEAQNNFATKDDLTALQSAIAELFSTIKANNINTQFINFKILVKNFKMLKFFYFFFRNQTG